MGLGLLEPLIYHGFCDLERPSRWRSHGLLPQLPSMIARIATESMQTPCTSYESGVSCEWAGFCTGRSASPLRDSRRRLSPHEVGWPTRKSKTPPCPAKNAGQGWGTRLDWAVKLVVFVRL